MHDLSGRVVLGTVQIGLPYGRNRNAPLVAEDAAFRILDAAWAIGVRAFDTAEAYGESASRLRRWIDSRGIAESVEVVTKCKADEAARFDALANRANAALSRFDGIAGLTLLTHGAVSSALWPAVTAVAVRHIAEAGQSVYSANEVMAACALPQMARLQAPGNVLDLRAIEARGNASIPLDVRSVYLQGVLLENPEQAEQRVPGSKPIIETIRASAAAVGFPVGPLLAASMLDAIGLRDRLVIGVDNVSELEALPAAFEIPAATIRQFRENIRAVANGLHHDFILDPRRWPAASAQ